MTYTIKKSKNGQYTVAMYARNKRLLNSSETLHNEADAIKNIKSSIKNHNPKNGTVFIVIIPHREWVRYFTVINEKILETEGLNRNMTQREKEKYA